MPFSVRTKHLFSWERKPFFSGSKRHFFCEPQKHFFSGENSAFFVENQRKRSRVLSHLYNFLDLLYKKNAIPNFFTRKFFRTFI